MKSLHSCAILLVIYAGIASGSTLEGRAPGCACPPTDKAFYPYRSGTVGTVLRCVYPTLYRCEYGQVSCFSDLFAPKKHISHPSDSPLALCFAIPMLASVVPRCLAVVEVAPTRIWQGMLLALDLVLKVLSCIARIPRPLSWRAQRIIATTQ
jgi:hypothetical protein